MVPDVLTSPAPRRDRRRAVWPADGPDRDSPRTQRRGVRYSPARRGPRGVRRGRREGHGRRLRWRHRRLLSVGYGATPRLLRFWRRAGYRTVHLSTSRNDASGEHSAIMLRPTGEDGPGSRLLDRHAAAFRDRERDGLSDAHRDVDPDVVAGALRACPASMPIDLTEIEWRSVVGVVRSQDVRQRARRVPGPRARGADRG